MDRLNEYKIAHRGLSEGTHTFDFVMDDNFFNCFEATKGTKGKVNARVNIVKSSLLLSLIHICFHGCSTLWTTTYSRNVSDSKISMHG